MEDLRLHASQKLAGIDVTQTKPAPVSQYRFLQNVLLDFISIPRAATPSAVGAIRSQQTVCMTQLTELMFLARVQLNCAFGLNLKFSSPLDTITDAPQIELTGRNGRKRVKLSDTPVRPVVDAKVQQYANDAKLRCKNLALMVCSELCGLGQALADQVAVREYAGAPVARAAGDRTAPMDAALTPLQVLGAAGAAAGTAVDTPEQQNTLKALAMMQAHLIYGDRIPTAIADLLPGVRDFALRVPDRTPAETTAPAAATRDAPAVNNATATTLHEITADTEAINAVLNGESAPRAVLTLDKLERYTWTSLEQIFEGVAPGPNGGVKPALRAGRLAENDLYVWHPSVFKHKMVPIRKLMDVWRQAKLAAKHATITDIIIVNTSANGLTVDAEVAKLNTTLEQYVAAQIASEAARCILPEEQYVDAQIAIEAAKYDEEKEVFITARAISILRSFNARLAQPSLSVYNLLTAWFSEAEANLKRNFPALHAAPLRNQWNVFIQTSPSQKSRMTVADVAAYTRQKNQQAETQRIAARAGLLANPGGAHTPAGHHAADVTNQFGIDEGDNVATVTAI
jgi:hypothetical protein